MQAIEVGEQEDDFAEEPLTQNGEFSFGFYDVNYFLTYDYQYFQVK